MTLLSRRNTRLAWALAASCGPLVLGACGAPPVAPPRPAPPPVERPGQPVVTVGAADDGASVRIERGQELRVALPLETESVNANMDWQLVAAAPAGVLEPLGAAFERVPRNSDPSETAGRSVWRFKPVAPGRVALAFDLRRARSLDGPVRSVRFDVTVK
ncbi:MAG: protease inhibitor I42 family protein [Pseudomonadota bacterium]|nr:protease inhibitor I42 family protein [Pseudomonadota bacterium]